MTAARRQPRPRDARDVRREPNSCGAHGYSLPSSGDHVSLDVASFLSTHISLGNDDYLICGHHINTMHTVLIAFPSSKLYVASDPLEHKETLVFAFRVVFPAAMET
ncbi:hypothetical protein MUK42_35649 [Musa troglodytarum]|uniref:Uncharacterized protein n=1 Tax=Musa troglodytarum TaxID=320322 RepID=A0A9E7EJC5_9LILI|nr:hypothetical protein MUK42_35649 [Musa troglodytarum]